jgi:hypothetical protein
MRPLLSSGSNMSSAVLLSSVSVRIKFSCFSLFIQLKQSLLPCDYVAAYQVIGYNK